MEKDHYKKGAHTVTELKYHYVWKTKYSYHVLQGKSSYRLQREFPQLQKRYWGRHFWARGYFCCTVGSVIAKQIKEYIENKSDEPKNPYPGGSEL